MEKKLVIHQVQHSPSSIFTKQDVVAIVNSVDENPIKIYQMELQSPMVSLFDFLGHAAGAKLGAEVYQAAGKGKQKVDIRVIDTKSYKGKVMLYRESFLKEYFKNNK